MIQKGFNVEEFGVFCKDDQKSARVFSTFNETSSDSKERLNNINNVAEL